MEFGSFAELLKVSLSILAQENNCQITLNAKLPGVKRIVILTVVKMKV